MQCLGKTEWEEGEEEYYYTSRYIPAYEVQLQEEADCNEAIWCKLVTGHTTVTIGVVYRCPNITKQNNEKIHNAISEVSKGDCIIMGDFNHGNIKWDSLQSTGVEDQRLLCLVQDNFLTQHVLEPTRAARVLDIVLSSQKEFVDNVVIQEPLGSSDHNQLHFNINIKSDKTKVKQCRRDFRKGNYKKIRKSLALIDWNEKMKNKTTTECWNILRGELDSAIDSYVPMKKQGKRSKKKNLSKQWKRQYNERSHTLKDLHQGQSARVQDYTTKKWEPAMINQKLSQPRSYMLTTNTGSQYRRNRRHIRTTTEVFRIPERHNDESTTRDSTVVNQPERPTCVSKRPSCVSERPTCVSERPTCVSERPTCVSERPTCVSERPTCVSERPTCVSERPTCVSERPTCVSDAPYKTRVGRSVRPPNRIDL